MLLKLLFLVLLGQIRAKPVEDEPVCGYEACPATNFSTLNVHLIPHSHDDVGWLKTMDQYYFQDVQNVISTVIPALKQNPDRRFVQVETAFFKKWWEQQKDSTKQDVIKLVNNGQFEIINGAWSMNDEANVHYQFTIDQYTLGLRYLEDRLGKCSRPKVCWQIDPFGHSREQASISAQLGFDSVFFARLDYRDRINRLGTKTGDLIWRGSSNLGNSSDIFTSVMYNHYSAPAGFCFDIVCNDEPIIDDEESPDYNWKSRVEAFANFVREQASKYPTNNILVPMGDDFRYQAALNAYINTDRLIKGFELFPQTFEGKPIKLLYSTPTCYTKAVNDFVNSNDYKLQIKSDDFFPYADGVASLVVGYITSRPASKRFVREANTMLQVAKQLAAVANLPYENENINSLKEAMGVLQHHDAITGTELIDVTHDYHRILHKGISDAVNAINPILSNIISGSDSLKLESCLLANVSVCLQAKADQFTLTVYNPLSRVVSSPISIPVETENWKIVDSNGDEVVYQVVPSITDFSTLVDETTSPNSLDFIARDIPALGYKVYSFTKVATKPTKRITVGADGTSFEIDEVSGLLTSVTMNGVTLNVTQDFLVYKSGGRSQAYVFDPDGDPQRVASTVTVKKIEGDVYYGVVQEFSDWAKQIIKVYKDDSSYIEFDWVIGPLNIDDGGKEVISQFSTPLQTEGVFYTDSNGREILKRVRNQRPDYDYTDEQPVAGNYYPVTSKILIRDENLGVEMAILNDRAQGGSSVKDGQVELMVHRRIRSGDDFGLDEIEYGHGIVVRGKHFLVLGPVSGNGEKSLAAIERDVAQRKLLPPWVFITNQDVSGSKNLEYSSLKRPLPDNVQLLTLEPWSDGTLLVRLEHVLEKNEDENLSKEVTVDLSDLFVAFTVQELKETTLAGNIPIEENVRLHWPGSTNEAPPQAPRAPTDLTITLAPMQIRTFLATVTYNNL
ncbi:lysosomal alpha-mannosidase [Tribolium castaneum]|uniref:lysosomal alpha-mannosidase n=1 Tax=Tribolium castaneum TaxID=7070 RepID=UPI0030FEC118